MERLNETRIGGVVAEAFAVRASTGTSSAQHGQHGAGIMVGLEAEVSVAEIGRAPTRGRVIVVPPHVMHLAHSPGPTVGLLFDPELEPKVAAFSRARGGAFALRGAEAARVLDAVRCNKASLSAGDALVGAARDVAELLAKRAPPPRPIDRRVARAIEALRAEPCESVVARDVSAAHLRALFARDVGMSMSGYRLWWRLLRGIARAKRSDWTTVAHAVGFSDLAHFSRTCRRMLGYSPSLLRAGLLR